MKKIFKSIICLSLVVLMFGCNTLNSSAKVIKGSKGRTYITLDRIEREENITVIEYCFKVRNYKVITNKNNYSVKVKTKLNCKKATKMAVDMANKLHGTTIEKQFKQYRTYNIKVSIVDKNGVMHTKIIKGHKVK